MAICRVKLESFGSSAEMTPPLSGEARVAEIALDCRPCFKRTCPLGHTNCLKGVTPQAVAALLWRSDIGQMTR